MHEHLAEFFRLGGVTLSSFRRHLRVGEAVVRHLRDREAEFLRGRFELPVVVLRLAAVVDAAREVQRVGRFVQQSGDDVFGRG